MRAEERRKEIIACLDKSASAVSGKELSATLGVSRQIIVQDIAVLRAGGYDIISTHEGYVIKSSPLVERVLKLRHTSAQTEDELTTIVDLGGTVVDVHVWHKVYGKIEAKLNIFSKRGIDSFIEGVRSGKSSELMNITSGYHYHTIRADHVSTLDRIEEALTKKGYVIEETK